MADADAPRKEELTEPPSPKKKSQARVKGNIPQSQDLSGALSLLVAIVMLKLMASWHHDGFTELIVRSISDMHSVQFSVQEFSSYFAGYMKNVAILSAPLLLALFAVSYVVNFAQVGPLFTLQPLAPKWRSLMPRLSQLNFLQVDKLGSFGISMLKLAAVVIVVYPMVKMSMSEYIPLMDQSVYEIYVFICTFVYKIVYRVALLLLLIAILDYLFKYWRWYVSMKMTKQQVKDEAKGGEMDPKVKGYIRKRQAEIMLQNMYSNVPKADVVITNPVHIAVAVRYEPETMEAPTVVAKGARLIAEKIKEIAKEHRIPIVENKPLARTLFKTVEVGHMISEQLYHAVAEVLSFVYKTNRNFQSKVRT